MMRAYIIQGACSITRKIATKAELKSFEDKLCPMTLRTSAAIGRVVLQVYVIGIVQNHAGGLRVLANEMVLGIQTEGKP